jgi:hypothetical protein
LLVLLNHGNRTPHVAAILARTKLDILSGSDQRIIIPGPGGDMSVSFGDAKYTQTVNPAFLYGKPAIPNFADISDEQHARYVHDKTLSLDALFPVYDLAIDSIDINAFKSRVVPPRAPLVSLGGVPMLFAESINECFAYRGTGKTLLWLSMGFHLAAGKSFADFEIPTPTKVVYIEGELPESQIQSRAIALSTGLEIPSGNFTLIARSRLPEGAKLDISTEGGRAAITGIVKQHDGEVLILDGLKSLGIKTTMDPLVIADLNQWLMDLRCHGLCVVFLHQAGVSGAQRGLSDLEDTLDLSIKLETRKRKTTGASFNMSFTKEREEGLLPRRGYACENGVWRADDGSATREPKPKEVSKEDQIRESLRQGCTYREIEDELQVSQTTIAKIKKEMTTDDHSS